MTFKFGIFAVVAVIAFNLALLAGTVWLIVWTLRLLGVHI